MTNRERDILARLRKDPLISQNELAEALGITRSSVAVHITNLMKKGHIVGKGYIVREDDYVCVIGGANIDIQGVPNTGLIPKDSNVGSVKMSLGGVGRNIAENLVRMGIQTRLISVIGDDLYGMKILDEAREIGLNMQDTLVLKGERTSTYLSILDETKDMAVAISDMAICDRMTLDFIKKKAHVIEHAALCVMDANLPEAVIQYILTTFKDKAIFIDTVSTTKARKLIHALEHVHTLKPNRMEAEILSGISIHSNADLIKAAAVLHEKGVKRLFISLGAEGVFYSDGETSGISPSSKAQVVSATGAGDAFIAGLAYAYVKEQTTEETVQIASAAAIIAIAHENTINPNMSEDLLFKVLKESK